MKKHGRTAGACFLALVWVGLALLTWFGPRTALSETERRPLAQMPQLQADTVFSGRFMNDFEKFTQDQFPLRERFRQLKAVFCYDILRRGDSNGIYLAEGHAAKLEYPLKESSVTGAIRKFSRIHDLYLQDAAKIVFAVAPDKGYYLAARNGYPAMDYEALFAQLRGMEWAEYVDLTDCLGIDSYYTTDTHWRQEALLPAAQKLAEALGVNISAEYTAAALDRPFCGVYYGQAAYPMQPDTMQLMRSGILDACTVTNWENGTQSAVYDLTQLGSRDLYDVFLSGPVSVLTVENPNAAADRELILFRDSFGSSLAPLLVPGYAKVTLVDIRYVPTDYLPQFVDFGNQDVLFLYSPMVLNNSTMLR